MNTVTKRPRSLHRSTARDMRTLMHEQGVTPGALAWLLKKPLPRALALRYWSSAWTIQDIFILIEACGPASQSVPLWGELVKDVQL